MMTSSGFISPAREGRLPDASRPAISNLATSSIPQDLDSATPPGTPTPPPYNQGSITPKIRGKRVVMTLFAFVCVCGSCFSIIIYMKVPFWPCGAAATAVKSFYGSEY